MKRILLLITILCATPAYAEQAPLVAATLMAKTDGVVAGEPLEVALRLQHREGWHTYYKEPGDAGIPTTLEWTLPKGFSASDIHWPEPEKITEGTLTIYGYHNTVLLPVSITTPKEIGAKNVTLKVKASWLVCKEICIPESATLEMELPVVKAAKPSHDAKLFAQNVSPHATFFPITLLFAVLGGIILNLMPCVLPVLSLKALALVKKTGAERGAVRAQGVAYTLGIILSFAAIASVLIGLQQAGEAVGWGYQMQSPAFVGFLVFLLFLVGLNLSGLFHLPVLLGGVGSELANESSLRGSFFTGILATAVATPCTAPFMASAVGVALTLAPWQAMLIFIALGFGLALPFLLISFFPAMLRFLPKPGAWMDIFRQLLAFSMYASVIWLIWVLALQVGAGGVVTALSALLFIVFIVWLQPYLPERAHVISALIILAAVIWSMMTLAKMDPMMPLMPQEMIEGMETLPFSETKLSELRAQAKTVLVDATAAWCITCQVNAKRAIHTPRVIAAFKEKGAVLMVADWTRRNPEITKYLARFGYNGVPLYVVYRHNAEPQVLPQILSETDVIEAIR